MTLTEIINHKIHKEPLENIKLETQCVINTINAHSYCVAKNDKEFAKILESSDVLLPDGTSICLASKLFTGKSVKKVAGWDIHQFLLTKANKKVQKVFYLGSSPETLELIEERLSTEFEQVIVNSYSPPFKQIFSSKDSDAMIAAVNRFEPDILFVGMTAPKQEKWVDQFKSNLNVRIIVSIGAVFDYYAGTVKRAPKWMIDNSMEWLYRLLMEPKRMWKRYLINNTKFLNYCLIEKINSSL